MAFTPDGKYAWVSNYSMYGKGLAPRASTPALRGTGRTRYMSIGSMSPNLTIDKVVPVGAVPKYVAVTPDGKQVLVTQLVLVESLRH